METRELVLKSLLHAYDEILFEQVDKSRLYDIHPSELPFCGHSFFYNYLMYGDNRPTKLTNQLALEQGITVHAVIQRFIKGYPNVLGDFACSKCGDFQKMTTFSAATKKRCKDCKKNHTNYYQYREIPLEYNGVAGHCDMLLKDGDNTVLVDFKTTTLDKVKKLAKNPYDSYIKQQYAYALLLRKRNVKVTEFALVFIPKEKPILDNIEIYTEKISMKKLKAVRDEIVIARNLKKNIMHVINWESYLALQVKKCDNPFCPLCRGHTEQEIQDILKNAFDNTVSSLPIEKIQEETI